MEYSGIRDFIRGRPSIYVFNIVRILDRLDEYDALLEETKQANANNQTKTTNEYNMSLAAYNQEKSEWIQNKIQHNKLCYTERPQRPILELSSLPSNYAELHRTDRKRANRTKRETDTQLRIEYEEKYAEYEKRELIPYLLNQKE